MTRSATKVKLVIGLMRTESEQMLAGLESVKGPEKDALTLIHESQNPFWAIGRMQSRLATLQALFDQALDERAEEERAALHEDGWRSPEEKG